MLFLINENFYNILCITVALRVLLFLQGGEAVEGESFQGQPEGSRCSG